MMTDRNRLIGRPPRAFFLFFTRAGEMREAQPFLQEF